MQDSKFEDYNDISKFYDNCREAMGYKQVIEQLEKPEEALVLDAGCGSGNYTMKLCKDVKKVVCFEVNPGMLGKLKGKLTKENIQNVELINGSLLEEMEGLAAYEGKFDMICINQVIHHLDTDHDTYPNFQAVVAKIIKFLKPGGKICINHYSQENLSGVWFYTIHPAVAAKNFARFPPTDIMKNAYKEAGFVNYTEVKCPETLNGDRFYNVCDPFDPLIRKTDSFYTDAEEYIEEYLATLDKMIKDGSIPQYLLEHEKIKQEHGHTTFFVGQKPV